MEPDSKRLAYEYKERKRKQNVKEHQEKFFKNLHKRNKNKSKRR